MLIDGRRVLITGAARGIGLAVARRCLAEGAEVLLTDSDEPALRQAEATLRAEGSRPGLAVMDVTDRRSIRAALALLPGDGRLDAAINNAAILDYGDAAAVDDARWNRVMEVNLTGALRVTQEALPHLRRSPAPAIVNTVSTQAFRGVPASAAYATAKGGLMMLTRSMAVDFGAEGIRVNAVAPGFIDTRMAVMADGGHEHAQDDFRRHYIEAGRIPLRRAGTPEDCEGAFLFLISDLSRYVTGEVILVDGGLSATY